MTHLPAQYRDERIQPFELAKLTPMDLHSDERWQTRDLPSIKADGLWYPILLYPVTLEWWNGSFTKWRNKDMRYVDPVINDGIIWAIKVGSNRYQCAVHLGYTTIDAIMLSNSDDCAKLGIWFRDCNPLNNSNAPAYSGAFGY